MIVRPGFIGAAFAAFCLVTLSIAAFGASPVAIRQMQQFTTSQFSLPPGSTGPSQITTDSSGRVWFVEQGSNQIGSYNPATGAFSEFSIPTPNALPEGIAVDQEGELWFTELTPNGLGVLTPGNGTINEITLPTGPFGLGCGPIGVTAEGNGSIWVTCEFSNQIDEYVPILGVVRVFDLPVAFSAPLQILFDGSGNFWFSAADTGMIGYVNVGQLRPGTTDGVEEFAPINGTYVSTIVNPLLPSGRIQTSLAIPSQIALSPDGKSLWITEHGGGSFDRYDVGAKTLTKYFTSSPDSTTYADSLPNGLAVDQSGDVWIAEHYGNRIAEFDPASQSMVEFPVPCCSSGIAATLYLAAGTNGTVWYTEFFGNAIGELDPVRGATVASLSVTPSSLDLGTSGSGTVTIALSAGTPQFSTSAKYDFRVAGVKESGSLQNITATFEPPDSNLGGQSTASATLTLSAAGLRQGVYYLTIGADSSSTGVISSTFLVLNVTGGNQGLILGAVLVAAAVVIGVGLYARLRRPRRARRDRDRGG